ncbi:MAG TPA: hypothetical protein VG734_15050 [Lacunisphaera sp.]|nr:hypothetical protein [Lacunisphaera sp.]
MLSDLRFALRQLITDPGFSAGVVLMLALAPLPAAAPGDAPVLKPGSSFELSFADADLPPTLYTMTQGTVVTPTVTVRLPDDYTPTGEFPVVVYVPGKDGGPHGNPYNAEAIAGKEGWIAVSLPLFKQSLDRDEPNGGIIVSFEDYPVLARAYRIMLGRLFEAVPNIDRARSAMIGFSNGAIAISVLVSHHDEFILTHFRAFGLVDHGMFHLMDLHKHRTRGCRFLILVGDQPEMGRELKLRQARLQQDAWGLVGVDVTCRVMENTGHEFNEPQMAMVQDWLRRGAVSAATPPVATGRPSP